MALRVIREATQVPVVGYSTADGTPAASEFNSTTRDVYRLAPAHGCRGWESHGHHNRHAATSSTGGKTPAADLSPEEREAAKVARKLVIDNNKAWSAAQPVRRAFLASLAKSKTPPKGTARFLATALSMDSHAVSSRDGNRLAAEWLGTKNPGYRTDLAPAKSANDNRCLVVTLVQVLAGYEAETTDRAWRDNGATNATGRYLRFLATTGYDLSDVEQYAITEQTA